MDSSHTLQGIIVVHRSPSVHQPQPATQIQSPSPGQRPQGPTEAWFIVLRKVLYADRESPVGDPSPYSPGALSITPSRENGDGKGCDWSAQIFFSGITFSRFDFAPYLLCTLFTLHLVYLLHIKDQ